MHRGIVVPVVCGCPTGFSHKHDKGSDEKLAVLTSVKTALTFTGVRASDSAGVFLDPPEVFQILS